MVNEYDVKLESFYTEAVRAFRQFRTGKSYCQDISKGPVQNKRYA